MAVCPIVYCMFPALNNIIKGIGEKKMKDKERELLELHDLYVTTYEEYGPHHYWVRKNKAAIDVALLFMGGE
jgi:hypothetical protein